MKRLGAVTLCLAYAAPAAAQCPPLCIDPKTGQVILAPRTVHVDPPPVHVNPQVHVDPPPVHVNPGPSAVDIEIERRRVAAWTAYFDWEAKVRVEVDASIDLQLRTQGRLAAQRAPDAWATKPLSAYGGGGGGGGSPHETNSFPLVELGPVNGCVAVFQGPGHPAYWGFCPPVRVRFNEAWGLSLDPSFVWQTHADIDFHTLGFHPAVTYSFAEGYLDEKLSHAFLRAGVDGWVPLDGGRATPDIFLGVHAGAGVHGQLGAWGMGAEVRALERVGIGASEFHMSRLRAGVEARVYVIAIVF